MHSVAEKFFKENHITRDRWDSLTSHFMNMYLDSLDMKFSNNKAESWANDKSGAISYILLLSEYFYNLLDKLGVLDSEIIFVEYGARNYNEAMIYKYDIRFNWVLDLLVRRDGKYYLYDYKMSSKFRADNNQLVLYAYMLERHYGIDVEDCFFIFPKVNKFKHVAYDKSSRLILDNWITDCVKSIKSESFQRSNFRKFCVNYCAFNKYNCFIPNESLEGHFKEGCVKFDAK